MTKPNFLKSLDKPDPRCYNKGTKRGGENGRLTLKKSPVARHYLVTYYKKSTTPLITYKKVLDKPPFICYNKGTKEKEI